MTALGSLYSKLYKYAMEYYPDDLGGFFVWAQEGPTEWGWGDDVVDAGPEISLDAPVYANYETQSVADFIAANKKMNKELTSLAKNEFNRTHSIANVEQVLSDYAYNSLLNGARRLKPPYSDLVTVALNNVSWDGLVAPYVNQYSGPQYMDDSDELDQFMTSLDDGISEERTLEDELNELLNLVTEEQSNESGTQPGYYDSRGEFIPYPPGTYAQ